MQLIASIEKLNDVTMSRHYVTPVSKPYLPSHSHASLHYCHHVMSKKQSKVLLVVEANKLKV